MVWIVRIISNFLTKIAYSKVAKRELKQELDEIRGVKKAVKADIERVQERKNEILDLKDKGLVSLKGDLMKELRTKVWEAGKSIIFFWKLVTKDGPISCHIQRGV